MNILNFDLKKFNIPIHTIYSQSYLITQNYHDSLEHSSYSDFRYVAQDAIKKKSGNSAGASLFSILSFSALKEKSVNALTALQTYIDIADHLIDNSGNSLSINEIRSIHQLLLHCISPYESSSLIYNRLPVWIDKDFMLLLISDVFNNITVGDKDPIRNLFKNKLNDYINYQTASKHSMHYFYKKGHSLAKDTHINILLPNEIFASFGGTTKFHFLLSILNSDIKNGVNWQYFNLLYVYFDALNVLLHHYMDFSEDTTHHYRNTILDFGYSLEQATLRINELIRRALFLINKSPAYKLEQEFIFKSMVQYFLFSKDK